LATAVLQQVNDYANYPYAVAMGIVLLGLILVLAAILTVLQQRTSGINLRFRTV
jgi:ABC-type spermidine/putrescine transport system permease subunit I